MTIYSTFACMMLLCTLNYQVIEKNNNVYHLKYTVTTRTPKAMPIKSTICLMLDSTPSFFIEHEITSGVIYTHYDGVTLYRCARTGKGKLSNMEKIEMSQVKNGLKRHEFALNYSMPILPCLIDPKAKSALFKHYNGLKGVFDIDEYKVSEDKIHRIYSAKGVQFRYRLKLGELEKITRESGGFELHVELLENYPVLEKPGISIKEHALSIFGENFSPTDITDDVIKALKDK